MVAEGVETRRQLEHLQGMSCLHGQRFLFARAMPAERVRVALAGAGNGAGGPSSSLPH